MYCTLHDLENIKIKGVYQVNFGPVRGYIVTIGEYGAPLKEHRENTVYQHEQVWMC